ncbi:hypothetical protein B0H16DRAFT_1716167 [Mycena metata]|uniref:Uncharacterized protein n=1 Tax=Mycena metata TaxID=1033252 RepID=A0AAD7JT61_9AGAR|nr:hypothetical protein B0H16DRAFT_1716167 [Mycena metata]
MGIPLLPRIDSTFGLDFIGVFVAAAWVLFIPVLPLLNSHGSVYGASARCKQTELSLYIQSHRSTDSWKIQTMVYTVFLLDTLHRITVSHAIYIYLITDFGAPEKLNQLEFTGDPLWAHMFYCSIFLRLENMETYVPDNWPWELF